MDTNCPGELLDNRTIHIEDGYIYSKFFPIQLQGGGVALKIPGKKVMNMFGETIILIICICSVTLLLLYEPVWWHSYYMNRIVQLLSYFTILGICSVTILLIYESVWRHSYYSTHSIVQLLSYFTIIWMCLVTLFLLYECV